MFYFLLEPSLVTFCLGIFTIVLCYRFATKNHDYWKNRGIPFVKPLPFFGSTLENLKKPLYQIQMERYRKLGPVHGSFDGNTPVLTVGDPTLLRDIMVKDFSFFTGRRKLLMGDKVADKMLTMIQGEDWRRIRSILTPLFTTGKLKRMLSVFKDCSETALKNLKKAAEEGKPIDAKKIFSAFTMDVITTAAFSTKIDSHNDPNNELVKTAGALFGRKPGILFVLLKLFPSLRTLFRLLLSNAPNPMYFFRDLTLQIVEQRRKSGQMMNDFLQLLLDTAKEVLEEEKWDEDKGDVTSNCTEQNTGQLMFKTVTSKKLSMDEVVSQCAVFFLAGFDTTASTLAFTTHLLALNPDVQEKLREEVDKAIAESNGELTYETLQNMKYMDNVISESLRIFPPAATMERYADADYRLEELGITVPKEMCVNIPVFAMHRDPKYYPDPERFDPDRFTAEEKAKRDAFTYLPFGMGPRNCIGLKFALLEIKVCLSYILANFRIKRSPMTKDKLEFQVGVTLLLIPKEIMVEMEIRPDSRIIK